MHASLICNLIFNIITDIALQAYCIVFTVSSVKKCLRYRSMFVDKFLIWKVFPIRCLRWILHLSVFEFPPDSSCLPCSQKTSYFFDVVDRLASIWSRHGFVQSSSMEQQACILFKLIDYYMLLLISILCFLMETKILLLLLGYVLRKCQRMN